MKITKKHLVKIIQEQRVYGLKISGDYESILKKLGFIKLGSEFVRSLGRPWSIVTEESRGQKGIFEFYIECNGNLKYLNFNKISSLEFFIDSFVLK